MNTPVRREWIQYGRTSVGRHTSALPSISTPLDMRTELGSERGTVDSATAPYINLVPRLSLLLLVAGEEHKISHLKPIEGTCREPCGGLPGVSTEREDGVSLPPKQSVPASITVSFHHDLSFFKVFCSYFSSTILCSRKAHGLHVPIFGYSKVLVQCFIVYFIN